MSMAQIRNIALVGHAGSGKTTLTESLLYKAGAIPRKGSIAEKNTISDFTRDERDRGVSLEAGVVHLDFEGTRINLIDCPGAADFIAGAIEGMAAAETALIAVNAANGVEVMTRKCWQLAETRGMARMFIVTKMDHERADFALVLERLKDVFGNGVVPLFAPLGKGASFRGVCNLLDDPGRAPDEVRTTVRQQALAMIETIVTADDTMLERYLAEETFTPDEIEACFRKGLRERKFAPVLCVAAERDLGTLDVLRIISHYTARPDGFEKSLLRQDPTGDVTRKLKPLEDGPLYAQVFKSKRDAFVGKLSYLRIFNGRMSAGNSYTLSSSGKAEKFAHLYEVQGKELKEIPQAPAGSVVAVAKHEKLNTGETIGSEHEGWLLPRICFPIPMQAFAVEPAARKDESKLGEYLRHLAEDDPTLQVEVNPQTHELILHGMGQLHLELQLHRLQQAGIEAVTHPPRVAYRSTIQGTAEVRYRHKKQSGGAGQFGEVQLRIEPNPDRGYAFIDEIVGGVIPNTLIPSVDKGVQKLLNEGVWPGIPVVDVQVRLNDGKHHPVDSKDIAFQIAGRYAFRQAYEQARPVLIEPYVALEVVVPDRHMGDISASISGKRGRIQGMDQQGEMLVLKAEAPLSELQAFAAELRSITAGEGYYSMEFSHYGPVPAHLAQAVIEAAKRTQRAEEE